MPRQIDEEDEAYQRPFDQKQFIRLLRYLIPHRIRVAYVIVLVIVAGFVNQATPYLMKIGIDT
ncbi:MAG TPA: ABC transporter ATP-binding protein, partial [Firmicutes bacterium]|nr:ABC transporter ATP-binding protein [Bacillota bacterium]